ncbi:MAG: squalene--hopene cyclase [Myxococcales bacterium]|nr:squalene--hopene cyclase [Myxococcales bacterium]
MTASTVDESESTTPLGKQVTAIVNAGLEFSRQTQACDGYWVGRLESNSCMEAEWILALYVLGLEDHPLTKRLGRALLKEQRTDGSWEVFRDAPNGDINTSVECYTALRCIGCPADSAELIKARKWILLHGGLRKTRVFTRYWLALLGEWPWRSTPNLPPEIVHCPQWFVFNIYNFASWARATLMPLSILSAKRPVVRLPPDRQLHELFPGGREQFDTQLPKPQKWLSWENLFLRLDRWLHRLQDWKVIPFRQAAADRVLSWIVQHQDADGVWGGIQPPWIYSLLALHFSGYHLEHPVLKRGLDALNDRRWRIDIEEATYISASTSPVWDTVLTLQAIQEAEAEETLSDSVQQAVHWLINRQVRHVGDWAVHAPQVQPGGWAFEYENVYYPDVDDTAVAVMVLSRLQANKDIDLTLVAKATERAEQWLLGMQSSSGGWAAFDRGNNRVFLTKIPFADFGEALDPPSVDITSHVLEALAHRGYTQQHPAVTRALAFIQSEQESNGSWFGRWGVNYIYGTAAVLPALRAVGLDMTEDWVVRAADWLAHHQNPDGGWGESCASYVDPIAHGCGPSTAAQTAWALMGLCAVRRSSDLETVRQGVHWLIAHQISTENSLPTSSTKSTLSTAGGTWIDRAFTGTGFPGYGVGQNVAHHKSGTQAKLSQGIELSRAFMLSYHLYSHYFPITALARANKTFEL